MFSIFGICALVVFILARPQEFIPVLQKLPLLYVFAGMAVGGFAVDLRLRRLEPFTAPTFGWAVLFLLWAGVCTAVRGPEDLIKHFIELGILFVLFTTLAHGVQRLRSFQAVAGVVTCVALFLTVVCLHQGFQSRQCVAVDPEVPGEGTPDGRGCEIAETCSGDGEPGESYRCEKVGMFGTYSIEDRVRYRGELHDPNELAMTICIVGLSFLIAFARRKKSVGWSLATTVGCLAVGWCVMLTQSRGGQMVMLIILGIYFVRRFGWGGAAVAAVAALPLAALALGGRSGEAADMSTQLRYEAWDAGLAMFRSSPIFGVGHRLFGEYHFMTAHNSYVLALAELGFVGLVLFVTLLYLSVKILVVGVRELRDEPGAEPARVWGVALLASMAGMIFQIGTLSFAYHSVLWIMLGLVAAWWSSVRVHKPDFQVKMTWLDLAVVFAACVAFTFFILPLVLRFKAV